MTPIVLKLFVTEEAGRAQAPGNPMRTVQAAHQRAINTATPGPNDVLFEASGAGNINLALVGVTDAVRSQFKGGMKLKVTIEDDLPTTAGS